MDLAGVVNRGYVGLRSSKPDGAMRQRRRRPQQRLSLYLRPEPSRNATSAHRLETETLDPSFVCNVVVEAKIYQARDERLATSWGLWSLFGMVRK